MIDQDQARKFWTNWVRREIGGSDMIQEAAVGAAVNEILLGHDNQAAADAARATARHLGGGLAPEPSTPTAATTSAGDSPLPALGGAVPMVKSTIPAAPYTSKPLFRRPWPYLAGLAAVAAAVVIVIFASRSVHTIGCLVSQRTLGHQMTTLHNTFVEVYNRDFTTIDACKSVDCEKAPKLEIAASLKTFNDGLDKICWPKQYQARVGALKQANTAMADAFNKWATATTPAEDQSLQSAAKERDTQQGVADDILSHDLGVALPTAFPSPS